MHNISADTLIKQWDKHWRSGTVLELFITINEEGLKLGTTVLAKYGDNGLLELQQNKQRILALLLVAYEYPFSENIIQKIQKAEKALHEECEAMMYMHFALAGFRRLEKMQQVRELFYADVLLQNGLNPNEVLEIFNL